MQPHVRFGFVPGYPLERDAAVVGGDAECGRQRELRRSNEAAFRSISARIGIGLVDDARVGFARHWGTGDASSVVKCSG